jgi:hypothetical protein
MADTGKSLDILVRLRADVDKAIADLKGGGAAVADIGKGAKDADQRVGGMTAAIKNLVATAAGLVSVRVLFNFIVSSIRAAGQEERSLRALSSTITQLGGNAKALQPGIERLNNEMKELGFEGSETNDSFKRLLETTESFALAQRGVAIASRLAKDQNISLGEATQQLLGIYNGIIPRGGSLRSMLSSVASEIDRGTTSTRNLLVAFPLLEQKLPAATANLDTYVEQTKQLAVAWNNVKEAVGGALIKFLNLAGLKDIFGDTALSVKILAGDLSKEQKLLLEIARLDREIKELEEYRAKLPKIAGAGSAAKIKSLEDEKLPIMSELISLRNEAKAAERQAALDLEEEGRRKRLAANAERARQMEVENAVAVVKERLALDEEYLANRTAVLQKYLEFDLADAGGNLVKEQELHQKFADAVKKIRHQILEDQLAALAEARRVLTQDLAARSGVDAETLTALAGRGDAGVSEFQSSLAVETGVAEGFALKLRQIIALEAQAGLLKRRAETADILGGPGPFGIEGQLQRMNSFFDGFNLRAREANKNLQSMGQIGGQTFDQLTTGLADVGAGLFRNLITGAKDFGTAARQAFANLFTDIASAIVRALLLRAIMSFLGPGISGFLGFKMAGGGPILSGTGPTSDDVPIMASRGEYVLNARATKHYGVGAINALNARAIPRDVFAPFAMSLPKIPQSRFATGGPVTGNASAMMPVVIRNTVVVDDRVKNDLFASSEFQRHVLAVVRANNREIARAAGNAEGFNS